jgi:hypothetical protein
MIAVMFQWSVVKMLVRSDIAGSFDSIRIELASLGPGGSHVHKFGSVSGCVTDGECDEEDEKE